ncbi:MAG TPA: hypothetical protein VIJ24_05965, partial [Verrucomicrobiae bacterium]
RRLFCKVQRSQFVLISRAENFNQAGRECNKNNQSIIRAARAQLETLPPTMAGQTCRFAPISPPASAAMLAEPWGYAHENIAPLVLVEVWAARQRRPTLVVVSSCAPSHTAKFLAVLRRFET